MGEDFGAFVDWSLMGDVSRDAPPGKTEYADAKECKRHARSGQWVKSHSQRALVYRHLIQALPCRSVTPDASVYRSNQPKRASTPDDKLKNGDIWTVALPEFASGAPVPRYCLKRESAGSVASVLERLASEFPDVSYCPLLPAVTALLLHWSSDEALCFEAAARLLATTQQRMLHQTFLAHRASCMTFGDLARKHCPAAHQHVVSLASEAKEDVAEVYGDWQHWVFGDLPFAHAARVMDVFLVEGFKVLYRVALALLKLYRKQRADRRKGSGGLRADLREFVRGVASGVASGVSPDKLMEKAFAIRLFSRKEISLLQLANERALQQKGITLQQKRCNVDLTVNVDSFSSDIISVKEIREVWSWIPERFALCQPQLLFSTSTHGCSLTRFYSHCEGHEPTLLLIKTTDGEVCGAFLSTDWEERKRGGNALSFFGTGECFVFKMKPEMERYEWVIIKHPELANAAPTADANAPDSDDNLHSLPVEAPPNSSTDSTHPSPFLAARHFILNARNTSMFMAGNFDSVIIGGGEGNALYFDSELNHGRTGRCSTFDNPPLCSENFQISVLEVWGFQDAIAT